MLVKGKYGRLLDDYVHQAKRVFFKSNGVDEMKCVYISFIGDPGARSRLLGESYPATHYRFPDGRTIRNHFSILAYRDWLNGAPKSSQSYTHEQLIFVGTCSSSWAALLGIGDTENASESESLALDLLSVQEQAHKSQEVNLDSLLARLANYLVRTTGITVVKCQILAEGWEKEPTISLTMGDHWELSEDDRVAIDITHGAKHHSHVVFNAALAAIHAAGGGARNVSMLYASFDQRNSSTKTDGAVDQASNIMFLDSLVKEVERTQLLAAYNRTGDLRSLIPGIPEAEVRAALDQLCHHLMVNDFVEARRFAGMIKGQAKANMGGPFNQKLLEAMNKLNIEDTMMRGFNYARYHFEQGNLDRALYMLRETIYDRSRVLLKFDLDADYSEKEKYRQAKKVQDMLGKHGMSKRFSRISEMRNQCAHAQAPLSKSSSDRDIRKTLSNPQKLKEFIYEEILAFQKFFEERG